LKPGLLGRYPNLKLVCATAAGVEKIIEVPDLDASVSVMRIVDPLLNTGLAQYVLLMALPCRPRVRCGLTRRSRSGPTSRRERASKQSRSNSPRIGADCKSGQPLVNLIDRTRGY
jgi:hypothetical protein